MKASLHRIALVGFMVLILTACNQIGTPSLSNDSPSPPTASLPLNEKQIETQKENLQMTQTPLSSSGLEFLIEKAKEELAQRLSIAISDISLLEAREVAWPDASLGCPQPGMKYKQVPEDGALIILETQGTAYEYHNGGTRGLFLCEKGPLSKPEKPPQIDITNLTPQILDKNNPSPTTPDNSIPPGEDQ